MLDQNAKQLAYKVAISDAIATREIVARVREISPNVPILARTRFVLEVDGLARTRRPSAVAISQQGVTVQGFGNILSEPIQNASDVS